MKENPFPITLDELMALKAEYPESVRNDPTKLVTYLALAILKHFLGQEWIFDHIFQNEERSRPQGFLRLEFLDDYQGEIKWFRFIDFAETLFNLQHIPGFFRCVELMKREKPETVHAEFDFARFLYIRDVDFTLVEPQGIKGRDYDFEITYADGRKVCADAKCRLETTAIEPHTLRYTLNDARKRNLPRDRPGMIFVRVPQAWLDEDWLRKEISEIVIDFLRQTGRVVAVTIYANVLEVDNQKAITWNRHRFEEFPNDCHRFDNSKTWAVFKGFQVPKEWGGMPPKWHRIFSSAYVEGADEG